MLRCRLVGPLEIAHATLLSSQTSELLDLRRDVDRVSAQFSMERHLSVPAVTRSTLSLSILLKSSAVETMYFGVLETLAAAAVACSTIFEEGSRPIASSNFSASTTVA